MPKDDEPIRIITQKQKVLRELASVERMLSSAATDVETALDDLRNAIAWIKETL